MGSATDDRWWRIAAAYTATSRATPASTADSAVPVDEPAAGAPAVPGAGGSVSHPKIPDTATAATNRRDIQHTNTGHPQSAGGDQLLNIDSPGFSLFPHDAEPVAVESRFGHSIG
jgi:hypothetical protein